MSKTSSCPLLINRENDDLFNFPCEFPIKVMGKTGKQLELLVIEIIRKYDHNLTEGAMTTRTSSGGKYVSVTVTFMAHSREQLDSLYGELTRHDQVMMVF